MVKFELVKDLLKSNIKLRSALSVTLILVTESRSTSKVPLATKKLLFMSDSFNVFTLFKVSLAKILLILYKPT